MTLSGDKLNKETTDITALTGSDEASISQRIDSIKVDTLSRMTEFMLSDNQHPIMNEFVDAANEILLSDDAKRLRCILPVMIAEQNDFSYEECLDYGIVIELMHYTSLIHDDVIDEDHYRRGCKTLNHQFPNSQAILIGDLIVCKAINYCLAFQYSSEVISLAVKAMKSLVTGILIEQRLLPKEQTISCYEEMAMLKTGSLFGLSIGLPFVGRKELDEALRCGEIFGTLFQVFDDYLDRDEDDPGYNIFGMLPQKEIIQFWDERMEQFMNHCRRLQLEPTIAVLFQHLQAHGYFTEISTPDGLLFRCPRF